MATEQVDKLITFGNMALEQGWYDQARSYFEKVLALDATNQEAIDGLARVDEILRRKASFEPAKPKAPVTKPAKAEARTKPSLAKRMSLKVDSAHEWIRKERKEHADRVAERKRLAAEEREKRAKEIAKREDEMLASGMAATAEPIQDEPEEKRGLPRLMQIGLILELIGTSLTLIGLLLFLLLFFMCLFPSCFKWL